MGWFGSIPLLSSLYGGDTAPRSKQTWPKAGHPRSDGVPLRPHRTTYTMDTNSGELVSADSGHPDLVFVSVSDGSVAGKDGAAIFKSCDRTTEGTRTAGSQTAADSISLGPFPSVSDSKQSSFLGRGSRRLAGFRTLFRTHRLKRRTSTSLLLKESRRFPIFNAGPADGQHESVVEDQCSSTNYSADVRDLQQILQCSIFPDKDSKSRTVSDQTVLSLESGHTNVTVHRHPSKRTSTPIEVGDRNLSYHGPLDEVREDSHSGTTSNPFTDPRTKTDMGPPIPEYTQPDFGVVCHADNLPKRSMNPIAQHERCKSRSSSQEDSYHPVFWEGRVRSYHFDSRSAALAFNRLALKVNLQPLILDDDGYPIIEKSYVFFAAKSSGRREGLIGKMRTMRSNLNMKPHAIPPERTLRRIKTLASLSSGASRMTSLRGRKLENLARLGGHSFLNLPADFAPTTLRLPTCFVASILYLRCYAPTARNVFFDQGDLRLASRLYDYYANEVLTAERENATIHMTMRAHDLPFGLSIVDSGAPRKCPSQVHSVATMLKSLLAGLPGGILGSPNLYMVLVDIYYRHFADLEIVKYKDRLEGISSAAFVRTKAISLAILALTTAMQLELICAVFGLCTLLLHETARVVEYERLAMGLSGTRTSFVSGALTLDRLGYIFGPLLIGSGLDVSRSSIAHVEREIESSRVATMLIENWRSVSRQLRAWGGFEYPVRRVAVPWTSSDEKSSSEERSKEHSEENSREEGGAKK